MKPRLITDPGRRFWSKVDRSGECWAWMAGKRRGGYGAFFLCGRIVSAHRFSWEMFYGPVPNGVCVLHRCDNPRCVRPDHLFIGTHADNAQDAAIKGRTCTIGKSRLTHCVHGHAFTPENTRFNPKGHRYCRTCDRRWREREKSLGLWRQRPSYKLRAATLNAMGERKP